MVRSIRFYIGYLGRFLRFYWSALTQYDVHSPFVSDFIRHVLEDERHFYPFSDIEALRSDLLRDPRAILVRDHGAGSKVLPRSERKVARVARYGAVSPAAGRQLFKVVHHYRPRRILEMGTSLGLSTLFLAKASGQSHMLTLEGCPQTAALAREHLKAMGAGGVTVLEGPFRDTLPGALDRLGGLDLLFLDGDHRKEPTVAYVKACLPHRHPGSIFIVADIHWSRGMEQAWAELRRLPEVTLSIDLFHFGLLFFNPALHHKAHFALVRSAWKPWRMGLFHPRPSGKAVS